MFPKVSTGEDTILDVCSATSTQRFGAAIVKGRHSEGPPIANRNPTLTLYHSGPSLWQPLVMVTHSAPVLRLYWCLWLSGLLPKLCSRSFDSNYIISVMDCKYSDDSEVRQHFDAAVLDDSTDITLIAIMF